MRVELGKKYTYAQAKSMVDSGELKSLLMRGVVMRQDLDGTVMFVPHKEASGPENKAYVEQAAANIDWQLDPVVRRDPRDRVKSLWARLLKQAEESGSLGLSDEAISSILGEAWKSGTTELTSETIKAISTRMLERAERLSK